MRATRRTLVVAAAATALSLAWASAATAEEHPERQPPFGGERPPALVEPGSGGELQLTDAIALLLRSQAVYGYTFTDGRYDTGQVLDYLKVIVELASERDDLGPDFRRFLGDFARDRDL